MKLNVGTEIQLGFRPPGMPPRLWHTIHTVASHAFKAEYACPGAQGSTVPPIAGQGSAAPASGQQVVQAAQSTLQAAQDTAAQQAATQAAVQAQQAAAATALELQQGLPVAGGMPFAAHPPS